MIELEKYSGIMLERAASALLKNNFGVVVCKDRVEALYNLKKNIPINAKIGFGGSKTLEQIGFFKEFEPFKYLNILNRNKEGLNHDQKNKIQQEGLTADVFVSSANALSISGELVLIDKWGNRSAAMTYGPKLRIFVIGKNKITSNLELALDRAKNKAAVINNIRFDTKNPCTLSGKCMDCNSENRICGVTTIIHRAIPPQSIIVILIDEDLGF